MLHIKSSIALLVLCSIAILSPAFGQTSSNAITVTTDKTSYSDGNIIAISGKVSEQLNIPISIVIRDPSNHMVFIGQVNPNSDNTYSTEATAGGSLWTSAGTYEVDVTYATTDRTAKTTFEFTGTQMQQVNQTGTNQTNTTPVIPEFGPLAGMIITISIISVIVASRKFHF